MAHALAALDVPGVFYSGYPRWKLPGSEHLQVRSHPLRTLLTYGLLRVPAWLRPADRDLFLWQDGGFDRWVGAVLAPCDDFHGIPGQCLHAFGKARALGVRTVLNHATGPVAEWVKIMEPVYAARGRRLEVETRFDAVYFERESREYALADLHCAASTVVRDQLVRQGVPGDRVWVVPYGADESVFHSQGAVREKKFRIVFAGQASLRKDPGTLLCALTLSGRRDWAADFFGGMLEEVKSDVAGYGGPVPLRWHGPCAQVRLAEEFRRGSVLVLPSLEEGFGLVVVQALACGLPCIVSDRVGAKDLVRHRVNGSVFASGDANALLEELLWWERNPAIVQAETSWTTPANTLLRLSRDTPR